MATQAHPVVSGSVNEVEGGFCIGSPACSGKPHTAKCRLRRYVLRQAKLDFTPPPESIPAPVDPAVPKVAKPRLTRQARAIYALLQQGPATADALSRATGSRRVAARVHDLRVWLRAEGIPLEPKSETDHATGVCTYWLEPAE